MEEMDSYEAKKLEIKVLAKELEATHHNIRFWRKYYRDRTKGKSLETKAEEIIEELQRLGVTPEQIKTIQEATKVKDRIEQLEQEAGELAARIDYQQREAKKA